LDAQVQSQDSIKLRKGDKPGRETVWNGEVLQFLKAGFEYYDEKILKNTKKRSGFMKIYGIF